MPNQSRDQVMALYRGKKMLSLHLFHLVWYMVNYDQKKKHTTGKGNPSPCSSQILIWLPPMFPISRRVRPSLHSPPPSKNPRNCGCCRAPFGTPRDLGIRLFHLAKPASPQYIQPSAAPGTDEQKPNRHGHERDRKNDRACNWVQKVPFVFKNQDKVYRRLLAPILQRGKQENVGK